MIDINKITKETSKNFIIILEKYIKQAKDMDNYIQLQDITTNMIEELREKSLFSVINGLDYYIIEVAKYLKSYDSDCKNVILNNDRLEWVKKEVKDNYFDYNSFEKDVKLAMIYTQQNYNK